MSRHSGGLSKSKDPRFTGKPLVDPTTGRGPLFRERIFKVLREEPDLETWQLAERFGVGPHTIDHYRTSLKIGRPANHHRERRDPVSHRRRGREASP